MPLQHRCALNLPTPGCGWKDERRFALLSLLRGAERDPTEHVDLAATMPAKLEQLKARLRELRKTLFNPDRCAPFTPETGCARAEQLAAVEFYGGYSAPYMP